MDTHIQACLDAHSYMHLYTGTHTCAKTHTYTIHTNKTHIWVCEKHKYKCSCSYLDHYIDNKPTITSSYMKSMLGNSGIDESPPGMYGGLCL